MALVVMMVVGEKSATESRLAALQAQYDPDVAAEAPKISGAQDAFAVMTRPLAPFRNWLRSRDTELNYRLTLAGYRNPGAADTFLSFKVLCPVIGIGLATFFGSDNFLFAALFLAVVGFFAPDLFLFRAISQRKLKLGRALPDVLDLLVICMEAGLGIDQATLKIAQETAAHLSGVERRVVHCWL